MTLANSFIRFYKVAIVVPKQAGSCGRGMEHHPRCQTSNQVQFSLMGILLRAIYTIFRQSKVKKSQKTNVTGSNYLIKDDQ